jgi:hypothetical protein
MKAEVLKSMLSRTPKTVLRLAPLAIAAATLFAISALAHHGWTGYDDSKTLNLTGTIRETGYENPHGFVRLQVEGAQGKTWLAILAPPSRMESRGLPKDALKVGSTVTVVGYPHRDHGDELRVERITAGGKTTELR